jgi:hypothetical protein
MLWLAAGLMVVAGIAHSYLGERGFLPRLLALPNLPLLRRDRGFTERVLRVIWHGLSIYWWAAAALLAIVAIQPANPLRAVGLVLAGTILLTGFACIYSGWRHPAISIFLAAGALTAYAVW